MVKQKIQLALDAEIARTNELLAKSKTLEESISNLYLHSWLKCLHSIDVNENLVYTMDKLMPYLDSKKHFKLTIDLIMSFNLEDGK